IRTVYSFVGEKRTLDNYSAALDDLVKLGVKQGLAKAWCGVLNFWSGMLNMKALSILQELYWREMIIE
ncbi:hypothetical protein KI387_034581, partial [Taxus chinensis]